MGENITAFPGLSLPAGHHEADPDLVERLEELLESARIGQLVSLAYAGVGNHEMIRTSWVGKCNRGLTGYAIGRLHHDFFTACADDD